MKKMNLNGNWELRNGTDEVPCPVKVPGTVISALYAAGKIPHPYVRENEYLVRELFWQDYIFVRQFEIGEELLGESEVKLVCEGLDTLAQIYLNGREIAATDNMHRTYSFSVKNDLCDKYGLIV